VEDRSVDVRLIAATSLDLGQLVRDGKFRSDLYFRISTLVLTVPSLRERPEDLPRLAQELLDRIAPRRGVRQMTLHPDAVAALQRYPWPGNVRELRNVLERAALLSDHAELRREDLHFDATSVGGREGGGDPLAAATTLAEMERVMIERAMAATGGKVAEAAQRLGIPRSTLYQKLKTLGISSSRS
jgi:DNA-binding NtrC family response regulator